jgi:hydrogenase nickel incorporation protein HypB
MMGTPCLIEVRQDILIQNDLLEPALRQRFAEVGTYAINLVSSPGSGKTAFWEKTSGLCAPNIILSE